jgi:hypothetical protein
MAPLEVEDSNLNSSFTLEEDKWDGGNGNNIELRKDLCLYQVRCEELEQERNYNAAKVAELQDVLKAYNAGDVQKALVDKSMQVAEISMDIDRLNVELRKSHAVNVRIQKERDADKAVMRELSGVVKSLQCASYNSDESEEEEEEEETLTPEKALDMTLKNLKMHVECLEDEHQRLATRCKEQAGTIKWLNTENELKDVKIEMLENLYRSLNEDRVESSDESAKKTAGRSSLQKAKSDPSLLDSRDDGEQVVASNLQFLLSAVKPAAKGNSQVKKARGIKIAIGELEASYTGPLRNDIPHGTGTIRFNGGDTYLGEVVAGEMHGKGTLYHRNRKMSRGTFEHNVFLGAYGRHDAMP